MLFHLWRCRRILLPRPQCSVCSGRQVHYVLQHTMQTTFMVHIMVHIYVLFTDKEVDLHYRHTKVIMKALFQERVVAETGERSARPNVQTSARHM